MSTVLIIGASGFLGRRLLHALPPSTTVGTCHRTQAPGLRQLNLLKPLDITGLVAQCEPSIIIFAAGLTDVDACEEDPALAWQLNAEVPRIIATTGVRMVYVSSDYVFDGRRGGYHEGSATEPVNVYGRSKQAGERSVLEIRRDNVVVRVSGLYDSEASRNWIFREPNPGGCRADDTRVSSPVHTDDVVSAVRLIIESADAGVFHVGGPDALSRYEFAQLVSIGFPAVGSVSCNDGLNDAGARRPQDTSLESRRLRNMGWQARSVSECFIPPTRTFHAPDRVTGAAIPKALLIDCVGGLLTERAWLDADPYLCELDRRCAEAGLGGSVWNALSEARGFNREEVDSLKGRLVARYAPNPAVWTHLIQWRKNCQLALTNNGPSETFRLWVRKYGLDKLFDVLANSEELGLRKPDPAFFLHVARELRTSPDHCVVLDDDPRNLSGARQCGMTGLLTLSRGGHPLVGHDWRPAEHDPLRSLEVAR